MLFIFKLKKKKQQILYYIFPELFNLINWLIELILKENTKILFKFFFSITSNYNNNNNIVI